MPRNPADRPATEPRTEAGRILLRRCESGGWITWDHQPVRLNGMRRAILAIEAEAAQEAAPRLRISERHAAENILNRPMADPDDDAAMVARAALRLAEAAQGAAPGVEGWQTNDDADWLESHREHNGHWRCSGTGDNGEPCEVIRAAPPNLYVELRDAISAHIEKAARETGTYHGDPAATPGGTGYCLPAAVATQIVDKYLLRLSPHSEGAAPRAEGLDKQRLALAIQTIRDYDDDYDAIEEADEIAAEYLRLSRPSDERVPESEEPRGY